MKFALAFVMLLVPLPVAALQLGPLTIGGDAGLVSDYRFRGVSLSNRDAAATGSLDIDTAPGVFAGIIGTTGSNYRGGDGEIDTYGGWHGDVGPVTGTAGVFHFAFPGASHADYTEVFGSVAKTLGPVQATLGVNYAPGQANLPSDNLYAFIAASAGVPRTPLTVKASVGYDNGGVARNLGLARATVDWALGAEARFGLLFVGARYVGNDAHGGGSLRDTVVVSGGVRF